MMPRFHRVVIRRAAGRAARRPAASVVAGRATGLAPGRKGAAAGAAAVALALALAPGAAFAQTSDSTALRTAAAVAPAASAPALTPELLEPFDFRLIGPANMSGRVTAIAVPDEPGRKTVYVGFATGGVWKTTNRGTTWRPVFDDAGTASVGDLAVSPADPDVVWVGTGERNSLRSQGWGDGVYRSEDGGRTWEHVGLESTRAIGRIALHPTDPDIAYVAALGHLWGPNPERGVYKTTDGGATWEKVLFVDDTTGFVDLKMDPRDPDVLYAAAWHRVRWGGGRMEGAGAGSGIWKTTDGGRTWTELTDPALDNGLPTEAMGRIGLGISPADPDVVYAVIQVAKSAFGPEVSEAGGVFRSDDAGATWRRVHDVSAVPDYYYNEIWLDPNDVDHLWLAQTRLQESTDGGATFETVRMDRVHVDHHAMWVDPDDSEHIILGNDGGVYVSFDGGASWEHHPMPVGQFYEVSIDSTRTPYHVCGGLQDNGVWCGPSATRERVGITEHDWYTVNGGDGFHSAVSPDAPHLRFAESQFAGINRWDVETGERVRLQPHAEDAGRESGYAFRWDWNTPFVISHHDPAVLYLGGNHLFKLTERGDRWEILGPDMTRQSRTNPEPAPAHTSYGALHSIAESPLDPDVIWTGSGDGLIWITRDGGETWTQVTQNIPEEAPKRCRVAEIEASRFDAARAYAAFDCHKRDDYRPYVYRTDDHGATWTAITGDLPADAGSYVIREAPTNPDALLVGNERGVYLSMHGGGAWMRLKNNLPTVPIRDMDVNPATRELVVGTYGRSIYILDIGAIEEMADSVLAKPAHLFRIPEARDFAYRDTYGEFGDRFFRAENPPAGATFTYYLRDDVGDDVELTIRRAPAEPAVAAGDGAAEKASGPMAAGREAAGAAGRTARPDGDVVHTITASGRPGVHRVTWDLRTRQPRPRRLGDPTSRDELRKVPPGTYTVTLEAGEHTMTRTLVIEKGWPERNHGRIR
ncbi:MAG TPA: hypothetical protein VF212_08820 [Longimicrobiales bacterium]